LSVATLLGKVHEMAILETEGPLFEREDWCLFRSLNTLGQKAGVPVQRIPQLVAKELVDNALDAAGACRIELHGNGFRVKDDGDGIPGTDEGIAALFSVNRPLTSSKVLRRPIRGALGNGLRVVAGAVLATGGSLKVATRGRVLQLVPQEDTGMTTVRRIAPWKGVGCMITVEFGASMPVRGEVLDWANRAIMLAGGESSYAGKSSPFWYDSEGFFELLKASGRRTARELIAELEGCSGGSAGVITGEFAGRLANSLDRAEAERLLLAARAQVREVRPKRLGRCGRDLFPGNGYAYWIGFIVLGSSASKTKAKLPVSIEVWAEPARDADVMLYVNRTPITGNIFSWKDKNDLRARGCGLNLAVVAGRRSFKLRINIDTPHMPITTDGKEPDARPFESYIGRAAEKAIRTARRSSAADPESRPTSKKEFIFENIPSGSAAASGDGQFRFAQRQLFYTIRPRFLEVFGEEPDWKYFCQVITDYEAENGDIPLMYRDPRGTIYHPHLHDEIPLGTLYVERYRRPEWLFNKLLYCEKEGFFSILRGVDWPERNDCALMSSKGFSSRAARDLIDMLAETDEECEFFCIHDADASGTMIYQTLVLATEARGARKVHVHNLGLDPAEARAMGLQVERFQEKDKYLPVADYIPDDDKEWLQRHRIEMNAMPTPQFLEWLDDKFRPYCGKLIPPDEALQERLDRELRAKLEDRITRKVLESVDIDGAVERALGRRAEAIAEASGDLAGMIRGEFQEDGRNPWTKPIDRLARKLSGRPGRKDTP
jgi:hypothetical protein